MCCTFNSYSTYSPVMTSPSNEYDRLLREARAALDKERAQDFTITGRAASMASAMGISLEMVRRFFLAEAFRQYIEEIRN